MSVLPRIARPLIAVALGMHISLCVAAGHAAAISAGTRVRIPAAIAVCKELGMPPAGVTELKFHDVFKLPVGPKGLEPTEKLLALDGRRVRLVGYVAQQEPPAKGAFLLSPLPVLLGDADESLADDLPPSSILVELPRARDLVVPVFGGLIQLTGTLRVGAYTEPTSGRVSAARLVLDRVPEDALRVLARKAAVHPHKSI
jgi:hypothetical protein